MADSFLKKKPLYEGLEAVHQKMLAQESSPVESYEDPAKQPPTSKYAGLESVHNRLVEDEEAQRKQGSIDDRGMISEVGTSIVRGVYEAGEMGLRALRLGQDKPGEDVGFIDKLATKGLAAMEKYKAESPTLQPKYSGGVKGAISEGVTAVGTSLTAGLPGAAAGFAATSWIPVPGARVVGTAMGTLLGYAFSAGGIFGAAQYDDVIERADAQGISREESEPAAIWSGVHEAGWEFASDVIGAKVLGLTGKVLAPVAKETLKQGISSLFKTSFGKVLKQMGKVSVVETGSEMITAGFQSDIEAGIGLGDRTFWDGAKQAFGPSFVASVIFGGLGVGGAKLRRKSIEKALVNPDADIKQRLTAAKQVKDTLNEIDGDISDVWFDNAVDTISAGEPISMDSDVAGAKPNPLTDLQENQRIITNLENIPNRTPEQETKLSGLKQQAEELRKTPEFVENEKAIQEEKRIDLENRKAKLEKTAKVSQKAKENLKKVEQELIALESDQVESFLYDTGVIPTEKEAKWEQGILRQRDVAAKEEALKKTPQGITQQEINALSEEKEQVGSRMERGEFVEPEVLRRHPELVPEDQILEKKPVAPTLLHKIDLMQTEVNGSRTRGVTQEQVGREGETVAFPADSPGWMRDIQLARKEDGKPALSRKELNVLFDKVRNQKPLTDIQQEQYDYLDLAIQSYQGETGEVKAAERVTELEKKGFEPYGDAEIPVSGLSPGDQVIATIDGVKDTYTVKGINEDGERVFQDGVKREVHMFDDILIEGVKKADTEALPGKADTGIQESQDIEGGKAEPEGDHLRKDWESKLRFYRSGKDKMVEMPNGEKAILNKHVTKKTFLTDPESVKSIDHLWEGQKKSFVKSQDSPTLQTKDKPKEIEPTVKTDQLRADKPKAKKLVDDFNKANPDAKLKLDDIQVMPEVMKDKPDQVYITPQAGSPAEKFTFAIPANNLTPEALMEKYQEKSEMKASNDAAKAKKGFDAEKFDRERKEGLKKARAKGGTFLDSIPHGQESMQGVRVKHALSGETGVITSAVSDGSTYVKWESFPGHPDYEGSESQITDPRDNYEIIDKPGVKLNRKTGKYNILKQTTPKTNITGEDGRAYILEDLATGIYKAGMSLKEFTGKIAKKLGSAYNKVKDAVLKAYHALNAHLDTFTFGSNVGALTFSKPKFTAQGFEGQPLVAVHNLSAENVLFAKKMGGLAVPSIAITSPATGEFTGFGEISLVADPSLIDPKMGDKSKVFNADAYSPRYPNVEFKPNRKKLWASWDRMSESSRDLGGIASSELDDSEIKRNGIKAFYNSSVAKYEYLKSIGKPPAKTYREKPILPEYLKKIKGSHDEIFNNSVFTEGVIKYYEEKIKDSDPKREKFLRDTYFNEDGTVIYRFRDEKAREIMRFHAPREIDTYAMKGRIDKKLSSKKKQKEFQEWVNGSFGETIDGDRIPNGWTYSGDIKYLKHDLDTVVKLMKKGLKDGEDFNYGVGSIRAVASKQFKSLSGIKKDRAKIVSKAKIDEVKKEIDEKFFSLAEELKPYYRFDSESMMYYDAASEAFKNFVTRGTYGFNEDFKDVSEDTLNDVRDFLQKLRNLPTEYFEAKIQRAVGLGEFTYAVVPKGTNPAAKKTLKDSGLTIRVYDKSVKGDRARVMSSLKKGVLFSTSQDLTSADKQLYKTDIVDTSDGLHFETGVSVTFPFIHNKESATALFGLPSKDRDMDVQTGRTVEASGRYVTHAPGTSKFVQDNADKFDTGFITFKNPLVLKSEGLGYKKKLSDSFGGLTGKKLSKSIISAGYDGVVTTTQGGTSEIIDFTTFDESKAKYSLDQLPGQGVSLKDIKSRFKNQEVFISPDNSISIRLKNGKGLRIVSVKNLPDGDTQFAIESGRISPKGLILGKYINNTITLNKDLANNFTRDHELFHFLTDNGMITESDRKVLNNKFQLLKMQKSLRFKPSKLKGKTAREENEANTFAQLLEDREQYRGTRLGSVLQKVADFFDGIWHIGRQSARKLAREVESGKIFSREISGRSDGAVKLQTTEDLVDAEGQSSIRNIMSTLRKAGTTKSEAVKSDIAKEQKIIEAYRKLELLAKDPQASVSSKQAMLASFLKVLPTTVRAKVITPLTFISRFKQIKTHKKKIDNALVVTEKELVNYLRRDIIAGIKKGISPKKLAKNRIKKGTMGHEAERDLQFIRSTLQEKDIASSMAKIESQIISKEAELEEAGENKSAIIEEQISDLQSNQNILETFGDLKSQQLEDLLFAREVLGSIITEGRALWRYQQEAFKDALSPVIENVQKDISGQEEPTIETSAEASKKAVERDTAWGKAKGAWDAVENSILSWEFLMNKLSKLSVGKVLKSYTTTEMGYVVQSATKQENIFNIETDGFIHSSAKRIFNAEKDTDLNKKFMAQEVKQAEKVFSYDENGKKVDDFAISQMEAAYMYAVRKNEDSLPTFEKMGMTEKTFEEIENFIGPELKSWVDFNMDEYLQDFHFSVNEVYRQVYGTNLTKTPGYISWYRDVPGKVQDKGIAASPHETGAKGMSKGAFKERVKNTNPYRFMSFNDVLTRHVSEMNNFKAWAMPTKIINGVFNNRKTQRLITQHHSANMRTAVKSFQTDFTKSPLEMRGEMAWLDKMRGNITTAMTALNPTIFLKQLTSIPAMAESIPTSEWIKHEVDFWKNPSRAWRLLKESKHWESRRTKGMERDIRTAQAVSGSQAVANVRNLKNRAMFLVKWGDGAAILVGGYPVYKYHFDKTVSSMGKTKAHKFALGKFEEAMDRTQQASGIKDQGKFQRSGSYAKLFSMFLTAPKQYTSQITAAVRKIHSNPKDGDAYKRLFIFGVMMPSLFQATASGLLGLIGGEDEDEKKFVGNQIKAILQSPLNGIPIIRDLQKGVWESAMGEWYGTDVEYSPVTQAGQSLLNAVFHGAKLFSEEDPDKRKKQWEKTINNTFETAGYAYGLPVETVRKMFMENWADIVSGETDYPFRRGLGFSRYAMGEQAKRYNRNKSKIKDAVSRRKNRESKPGDKKLLRLGGYLKKTEKTIRNLTRLKKISKTDKAKSNYSKRIEKIEQGFNKRMLKT